MILHYLPTHSIIINGIILGFGEIRESIRVKLATNYKEDNQTIQMRDTDIWYLHQRRDIYQNINGAVNFFFLGYDENDFLSEIEVHQCDEIKVLATSFSFNDELDAIVFGLQEYSSISMQSGGEVFFKDLRIVLMDKEHIGADGSTLGYFYCASDVEHLQDINML